MRTVVMHPTYGEITYEESLMSGRKTLYVNGSMLVRRKKNEYLLPREDGTEIPVRVKGSFLTGVKALIEGNVVQLTRAAAWYEVLCSLAIFFFVIIWGASPSLCLIFPIIGGAIGGAVSGMMTLVCLYVMKSVKPVWLKLLLWLAFFAATLAICFVLALVFVALLV